MRCIGIDLLSEPLNMAGTGVYARNLIEKLANLNNQNRYFVFLNQLTLESFYIDRPNLRFVPCTFPIRSPVARRLGQQFLVTALSRYRPDVLHSINNVLPLAYRGRCVVTIHDLAAYTIKKRYDTPKNLYLKLFVALSVRKAHKVIAVSNATKKDIENYIPSAKKKVVVIPNGVAEIFQPLAEKEAMARVAQYGLKAPFLLYVGRLERGKNVTTLLRAYWKLGSAFRAHFKLVLVGPPGDASEELAALVKKLNIEREVFFTGYVSNHELVALYSLSRALILPSVYEGFGLPLLEAMACGAPVIATATSSIPEVVGEAALLVQPYDVERLSDKIAEVCWDDALWNRLRRLGFEQARKFSWEATAQKTLQVYKEVLTDKQRQFF